MHPFPFRLTSNPRHDAGFDGRIAVIIPSFNHARFLERALCSVLDQHDPNVELHVVDGGSDDDTLGLLAAYDHQLASWTTAWDSGPAEAINHGLARCRGDLVVILAADDVLLPGALLELRRAASLNPAGRPPAWFVGDTQGLDEADQPVADAVQTRGFATAARPLNHVTHALLDPAGPPPLSACAFRRGTLDLMTGCDTKLRHSHGDDLLLRLLDQGFTPKRIAAPFAGVRETTPELVQPQAPGFASPVCPNPPLNPADVMQRQAEVLDLLERFADRLAPAHRFALAQETADRRHLLKLTEAHGRARDAPLWLAALRHPWRLGDAEFRRTLLSGQPAAALEQQRRAA
ncbi:MAG: glycosyltransferase [Planctomycetota bacterium]